VAFKQNEDFLRYLTMGAVGSAAVARYLNGRQGHRVVELERYTMANKIWATKVKRLRLPDLMCLDCGMRVEARAKSKLEIKMSDSETPGRAWYASLRGQDLIAFLHGHWEGNTVVPAGRPEFFTVEAMRAAKGLSRLAVCRRERVFSEESALGGRFEVKIRATDAILPSHSTINEVGKLLSDRLLSRSPEVWHGLLSVVRA